MPIIVHFLRSYSHLISEFRDWGEIFRKRAWLDFFDYHINATFFSYKHRTFEIRVARNCIRLRSYRNVIVD